MSAVLQYVLYLAILVILAIPLGAYIKKAMCGEKTFLSKILTPCEKPVATGSAGHCEPGVGRFTDPHPFTCSFFTPPFCWLMFGLCAPPKILPNPVLCVEKNILFHRGHPVLQCAAFAGPTGSAFSFLLFHSFSHPPLLSGGKTSFLSAGG